MTQPTPVNTNTNPQLAAAEQIMQINADFDAKRAEINANFETDARKIQTEGRQTIEEADHQREAVLVETMLTDELMAA